MKTLHWICRCRITINKTYIEMKKQFMLMYILMWCWSFATIYQNFKAMSILTHFCDQFFILNPFFQQNNMLVIILLFHMQNANWHVMFGYGIWERIVFWCQQSPTTQQKKYEFYWLAIDDVWVECTKVIIVYLTYAYRPSLFYIVPEIN